MKKIFLYWLLFTTINAHAQEEWTLQKCVEYAREKSLSVQQSNINIQNNIITHQINQSAWLPTVSANANTGMNFGRSVDLTTYQFTTQLIGTMGVSSGVNMPIYQGGRIKLSQEQSSYDIKAAEEDKNSIQNDIALRVAQAYLNVVLAEEALRLVQEQNKATADRLAQTKKMIQAGTVAEFATLELEAQLVRNEQTILSSKNNITTAYLILKQTINLPADTPLKVLIPNITIPDIEPNNSVEDMMQEAIKTQPSIKANEWKIKSALTSIKLAKTGKKPIVSGFWNINTNYSSRGKRSTGEYTTVQQYLGDIEFGGQTVPLILNTPRAVQKNNPIYNQLWENLYSNIGVSVNVPIYDRHQTRNNTQRAELALRSAELANSQTQVQLRNDIQRALNDVKNAYQQMKAIERSIKASKLSLENVEKRFNLGAANSFDITVAQSNLTLSELQLIQAKYDYFFKLKVLDFYQGKPIQL